MVKIGPNILMNTNLSKILDESKLVVKITPSIWVSLWDVIWFVPNVAIVALLALLPTTWTAIAVLGLVALFHSSLWVCTWLIANNEPQNDMEELKRTAIEWWRNSLLTSVLIGAAGVWATFCFGGIEIGILVLILRISSELQTPTFLWGLNYYSNSRSKTPTAQ
jgi:hypothetical protein